MNNLLKNEFWFWTAVETNGAGIILFLLEDVDPHLYPMFHHVVEGWFDIVLMAVGLFMLIAFSFEKFKRLRPLSIISSAMAWVYMAMTFLFVALDPSIPTMTTPALFTLLAFVLTGRILINAWKFNPKEGSDG